MLWPQQVARKSSSSLLVCLALVVFIALLCQSSDAFRLKFRESRVYYDQEAPALEPQLQQQKIHISDEYRFLGDAPSPPQPQPPAPVLAPGNADSNGSNSSQPAAGNQTSSSSNSSSNSNGSQGSQSQSQNQNQTQSQSQSQSQTPIPIVQTPSVPTPPPQPVNYMASVQDPTANYGPPPGVGMTVIDRSEVTIPKPNTDYGGSLYDHPSSNPSSAPPPPPGAPVFHVSGGLTSPVGYQGSLSDYQGTVSSSLKDYQGPINYGGQVSPGAPGPRGPPGPPGPKGDKGDKGDPGQNYDDTKIKALEGEVGALQSRIKVIDELEKQLFPPWAISSDACPDGWTKMGYFQSENRVHCMPPLGGVTPGNIKCAVLAKFPEHYDRCGWSKHCKAPWTKYNCYPYVVGTNAPLNPVEQKLTEQQELKQAETLREMILAEDNAKPSNETKASF